jgi:hypothetical protein
MKTFRSHHMHRGVAWGLWVKVSSPPGFIPELGTHWAFCGVAEFEDSTNYHDVGRASQLQFLSVCSKEAGGNDRKKHKPAKEPQR